MAMGDVDVALSTIYYTVFGLGSTCWGERGHLCENPEHVSTEKRLCQKSCDIFLSLYDNFLVLVIPAVFISEMCLFDSYICAFFICVQIWYSCAQCCMCT